MNIAVAIASLIIGFVIGLLFYKAGATEKQDSKENPAAKAADKSDNKESNSENNSNSNQIDSGVLEKKILYDEELTSLFNICHELSGSMQLKDVAKIIVENIRRVLSVEKCAVLLLDDKAQRLRIEYSYGLTVSEAVHTELVKSESISGWVFSNDEVLFAKNIEDDYWLKSINKETYYTRSLLSLPLSIKGKVLGVLNVNNKMNQEQFSDEDIRLLKGIAAQSAAAIQNARLYQELQEGYLRTITALAAALDAKDPYTRQHSENVTRYSIAIAKELNLTDAEVEEIRRGGLLHDIGKIAIQDTILSSPRKLTPEEYDIVKMHPAKGQEIVGSLPFLCKIALYIRQHHERVDGRGYPDGIKGHQIETLSRILAVADAFDAMVSDRPYRKGLGLQAARDELKRCSGTQFDSEIVEVFLKALEKYPDIVTA